MKQTHRLDKIISNTGKWSRTDVKKLVKFGLVKVDGIVVKDSSIKVCPESQEIIVDGQVINYKKYIYIMMNKPQGIISATYDPKQKTCIDLLPYEFQKKDLFPAGRLDIDTEGMLLLTNDGQLAHNILSPKKHVWKKYYAKIAGKVTEEDIKEFKRGVVLDDGYKSLSADLKVLSLNQTNNESIENSEVKICIKEGKFHQIKRMFEALGKKVVYLKRIQIANIDLDETLKLGEYRELTDEETKELLRVGGEVNE